MRGFKVGDKACLSEVGIERLLEDIGEEYLPKDFRTMYGVVDVVDIDDPTLPYMVIFKNGIDFTWEETDSERYERWFYADEIKHLPLNMRNK